MIDVAVVVPVSYAVRMAGSGRNSGTLHIKCNRREGVVLVDGVREGATGTSRLGLSPVPTAHALGAAQTVADGGLWYRVTPDLHAGGVYAARRGAGIPIEEFRARVVGGDWTALGRGPALAVTVATGRSPTDDPDELGVRPIAAWHLDADEGMAEMISMVLAPEELDILGGLGDAWPLRALAGETAVLIGAGSIGGAAAEALLGYGLRRLILVDPDRLQPHNLARHRLGPKDLGRHKVAALADHLRARDHLAEIEALPIDVIYDADQIRPVLDEATIALVTSDGVDSRRAANHLVRQAGLPAVFASVLVDGAFGEIIRIRPPADGCLLCVREKMIDDGVIDPEPALDRGYGTGTRHLPMTAVGTDLEIVGTLGAKMAIATLLERHGHRDQRLPSGHLVVALQPKPGLPEPFDAEHAMDVRWRQVPAPRTACPACGSRTP